MRWIILLLALSACVAGQERGPEFLTPKDPTHTILYYPGPGIDLEVAQDGAEKLLGLGVELLPTSDLTEAQIRLRFIHCTYEPMGKIYLAVTYNCGDIETCSQYPQEAFTYAHEIGHAVGMGHIDEPGIMYPDPNNVPNFTTSDLEEFEKRDETGSVWDPVCADYWKSPFRRID